MAAAAPPSPGRDVLFVTQNYAPEIIGSAPFCADIAQWLKAQGATVRILTGRPHYPRPDAFAPCAKSETIDGIEVTRIASYTPTRRGTLARILGELSFFLSAVLAVIAGRTAPSSTVLSLCPSVLSVAVGCLAKRRNGRHVTIVHDIQSGLASGLGLVASRRFLRLIQTVERMLLNRVDLVCVLSEEMARALRDLKVTAPIEVVPLWVDTARISVLERAPDTPPTIVYSGNLGRKQGLHQIVALALELAAERPDIAIVVRGSGSEAASLAKELEARGLANVRLEDLLRPEDFVKGLAAADLYLVPQDPKGADFALPSKIFNIMAAGRPFVATAGEATALWRLRQKSGAFLCVPPNDAAALADAVIALIDDREKAREMGRRGRRFVEAHHSKEAILGQFSALIGVAGGA